MVKRRKKGADEVDPQPTGYTSRIREAVSRIVDSLPADEPLEAARSARRQMKRKESRRVVQSALERHFAKAELIPYQAELIKLQQHLERTGRKMIILFDGRDASGKGGTIRRVTRYMNEKHYRVVALGKPTEEQTHRAAHEALHRAVPARRRDRPLRSQLVQPRHGRAGHGLLHQGVSTASS